ncbi:tyrosine-protein phosphatase [Cytobacillus purgationiresistens]|uniref:Protein-tyrosine phosphatase n=1 Tax=Cytobacillus purgationiresistens TaxID=863449 RepID=A0ABU0AGK9_9BACI|nr:tyrosine-protein phosphatase [Cytobacillus purgationiresistens]MDQ0270402.1 protein-tyrosine phosphatase [Cytobacillus purgationiresistens]
MTEGLDIGKVIPLIGAVNFRDMGGLLTADGRRIKIGQLYRAAALTSLTDEDRHTLARLEIKRIFDYRTQAEAERQPDPNIGLEINERISVMKEDNITTNMFKEKGYNEDYYKKFTRERFLRIYAEMPIKNPSYARLMELIRNPKENLPLVHHCTGGRDRTGVGSMLILLTLGVPFQTVMEDYLFSNEALEAYHNRIFKRTAMFFNEVQSAAFQQAFLLQEEYLHAAMNAIIHTYGNFETYLEKEFDITEEIRTLIQDEILE